MGACGRLAPTLPRSITFQLPSASAERAPIAHERRYLQEPALTRWHDVDYLRYNELGWTSMYAEEHLRAVRDSVIRKSPEHGVSSC
jgi:hypothetical protein